MGFLYGTLAKSFEMCMNVTDKDLEFMMDCQERDIATILVDECGMTIHQALDVLYGSKTYALLHNPKTGLYYQSPRYVYSILEDELKDVSPL